MKNELQILIESLEKKIKILDEILAACKEQEKLSTPDAFDAEKFDGLFDQKEQLLTKMDELDQGFEATFSRIQEELLSDKEAYKVEIAKMQKLIRLTVDRGAEISTTEARTKDALSTIMQKQRQDLAKRAVSARTVMDHYKSVGQVQPFFMDQKQ